MYHGKLNQRIRGNTNYFANLQISQRSSSGQILINKEQIYSLIYANFPTYILTLKADKINMTDVMGPSPVLDMAGLGSARTKDIFNP